jgi:rod shape determining protein RodA
MADIIRVAPRSNSSSPSVPWRHLDISVLVAIASLCGLGLLMISSATRDGLAAAGEDPARFVKKQILFMLVGFSGMLVLAFIDIRSLLDYSPLLYCFSIVSLVGLFAVQKHNGARGWYDIGVFQLQPAEFAKLVVIIVLAAFIAEQQGEIDFRRVVQIVLLTALPAGLIFLQPDLGSALVFFCVMIAMLFVSGARGKHIGALVGIGASAVFVGRRLRFGGSPLIQDYQWNRLTSFLDAGNDIRTKGWNVAQSKIAIGSGGLTGKGLYQGTQTKYRFIPERHTDFIFSVIGEQLGFVGGCVVLVMLSFLCLRIWRIAVTARDTAGTMICVGVLAVLVFQIFENIGMTIGIMPITGLPLPFVSYGGSSILSAFAAVGLVLNVGISRHR